MSTLAYGWMERCSGIASCGEASSQVKYFLVFNLCNVFVLQTIMNMMNALFLMYINAYVYVFYF